MKVCEYFDLKILYSTRTRLFLTSICWIIPIIFTACTINYHSSSKTRTIGVSSYKPPRQEQAVTDLSHWKIKAVRIDVQILNGVNQGEGI